MNAKCNLMRQTSTLLPRHLLDSSGSLRPPRSGRRVSGRVCDVFRQLLRYVATGEQIFSWALKHVLFRPLLRLGRGIVSVWLVEQESVSFIHTHSHTAIFLKSGF